MTGTKLAGVTRVLTGVVVLAVIAVLALVALPDHPRKYLTASFPRTVSLYEGSDVRILGVPVGKVESVRPAGTVVNVRMWYDAKYKVPADAKAVIISPAVVGDRFVQLTPVYRRGEVMANGARLGVDETSTPLELDEIYASLDQLNRALGPKGANDDGALTRLLDVTAENYAGQGAQFNETIRNLGKLTGTLADNKDELFGTAREIERFVGAVAENDRTVRRFNDSLAGAADLLADERDDLAEALRNLAVAMKAVSRFVRENREVLSSNIEGLNRVSKVLVKQRAALDEILTVAPTALTNLFHTYNPDSGTLDTRSNIPAETLGALEQDPALVLCGMLHQVDKSGTTCDAIRQALPRPAAFGRDGTETVVEVEHIDRSLGGIVEVTR